MSCGCTGCAQRDPRGLVRTGTSQAQRSLAAPDPARLKIDERRPEHGMVFAPAYARHLPFVDDQGAADGTWEQFFAANRSARLAAAAIEDVSVYRTTVQELLRRLTDPELPASGPDMIEALGAVFDCVGTLARRLDALKEGLPEREPLRATLGNLVRSRLSPVLRQLIGYYLAGADLVPPVVVRAAPPTTAIVVLGRPVEPFDTLLTGPGLSSDWPEGVGAAGWAAYATVDLTEPKRAYGSGTEAEMANRLGTHNLFTAAGETFLAAYARVVTDAGAALRASLGQGDHHPHYALFLAFLRLLDHARDEVNTLTRKHLDFYYRRVLRLAERPAQPSQAHVLVEVAKHVDTHRLEAGTLLKAGRDVCFGLDRDLVANRAVVDGLRSLYRHRNSAAAETLEYTDGRIYADPVANEGESWSPFTKKTYVNGQLTSIDMPRAEVGFAVASHHLWLAEGTRTITLTIDLVEALPRGKQRDPRVPLRCRLTTAKGWIDRQIDPVVPGRKALTLSITLVGNDPAVTPFDAAVHGYGFDTALPLLLVTLPHEDRRPWPYPLLAASRVESVRLVTQVDKIKTLTLANDQGPIDPAKPFLAFGSVPTSDSALVIGSQEAFQKSPTSVRLDATLVAPPVAHDTSATPTRPAVSVEFLNAGEWPELLKATPITTTTKATFTFGSFAQPPVTTPDLTPGVPYTTTSRAGFIRLRLDRGFGTDTYPIALAGWVARRSVGAPPTAPVLPVISSLTLGYDATQRFDLAAPSEARGRFFHVAPFGHVEQRAAEGRMLPLLPLFLAGPNEPAEGELYLGISGLQPPQNLTLLFQVADGTADPLAVKPENHLRWSYLLGETWVPFEADAVDDLTEGLLASGVVTLAVPADATTDHTLMPRGRHWIRIAVASGTDAVCRLVDVSAQAVRATSTAPGADAVTVTLPAGTISKLDTPDPAVKAVSQPYPAFGGRPVESPEAFDTRVSERLRHKDRAITLWDYEHLVLEAFPDLYQVRCLNHTRYEPISSGSGGYSELAPGHVTVVTIPDLALPNPRDPLRPFTSLRVLGEVERLLRARMSCFAELHVRNPQFEEVRVALRVRLREGVDETFHLNRLEREITEFLSPWAFRPDARPAFNGTVHRSVLVNFVEEQPYVDYVTDVQLFRKLPDATAGELMAETVVGSRAISILVSAPRHTITAIHTDPSGSVEDCACLPLGVS